MKLLRLTFLLSLMALCARGDDDDQQQQQQQEDIPDFRNLDEFVHVPTNVVYFGYRYTNGVKMSFSSGTGSIDSPQAVPNATAPNISRTYRDGVVQPDARTQTVTNADGTTSTVPLPADGKTNTWTYSSASQLTPDGFMQYHLYSAQILDSGAYNRTGPGNLGLELVMAHDMGKLGKRMSWKLFGGFSLNDIRASGSTPVKADVTTLTDTYDLFGKTPPAAPYAAPSSTVQAVTNSSGAVTVQPLDTTVLLGNAPLDRSITRATDMTSVLNLWKLHGAYVTFRGGPSLVYDINDRLHLNVSVGPVLIYAGSSYDIGEDLIAPTGQQITDTVDNTTSKLLLGYYGDATLQYDITDRTGFYFGAFYQDAGGYTQTAQSTDVTATGANNAQGSGSYTAHIELGAQQGFRTGLSFKF